MSTDIEAMVSRIRGGPMGEFKLPDQYERFRVNTELGMGDKQNGKLLVRSRNGMFVVLFSNGMGWEHVSVSRGDRPPTFAEMEQFRLLFWGTDSTVMQLHVPRRRWVNQHPNCLHLWRPIDIELPLPPDICV